MGRSKKDFFDKEAPFWEEKHYLPEVRKRLEELVPKFGVVPGHRVLDVGSGSGVLIPYLRKALEGKGLICSFDLSFNMTLEAKKKLFDKEGLVVCADVHSIPFRNEVFDRVICFAAFPHFDFPEIAILEMARVLKRGGKLIIAHLLSREELSKHHATREEVSGDVLPSDERFKELFEMANLAMGELLNQPGLFITSGFKR